MLDTIIVAVKRYTAATFSKITQHYLLLAGNQAFSDSGQQGDVTYIRMIL